MNKPERVYLAPRHKKYQQQKSQELFLDQIKRITNKSRCETVIYTELHTSIYTYIRVGQSIRAIFVFFEPKKCTKWTRCPFGFDKTSGVSGNGLIRGKNSTPHGREQKSSEQTIYNIFYRKTFIYFSALISLIKWTIIFLVQKEQIVKNKPTKHEYYVTFSVTF